MREDMHYYGTLAIALAAGIPQNDAQIIAYAAQYVDDSTGESSRVHKDHGMLYAIGTAHNPVQSILNRIGRRMEGTEVQRKIWIPFHFLPGGKGETLSEKLICLKNSDIAREMLENNFEIALKKPYGIELMGITAHVFMDTFSHYGFSGITSSYNRVNNETIQFIKEPENAAYIKEKFKNFFDKRIVTNIPMDIGHAGVATYPDRPYLQWCFNFEKPRPHNNEITSIRDNRADFLEACKCLYTYFKTFAKAKKYPAADKYKSFKDIEKFKILNAFFPGVSKTKKNKSITGYNSFMDSVMEIISKEVSMVEHIKAWKESGLIPEDAAYDPKIWENERNEFCDHESSSDAITNLVYRFHQAATFHRYYVLKDLLPKYGIAVF